MRGKPGLLERERELAAIESFLDATASGRGAPLLIEGEAGAGKTALLAEAIRLAEQRGFRVLRARGGEYERDFPYGVVRQLFEPALDRHEPTVGLSGSAAMAAPAFEAVGAEEPFSVQHGLYWLTADLAESEPLLLAVDDAQWADLSSLQALAYIGRRLGEMGVGLAMTVRTGEDGACAGLLAEITSEPGAAVLTPSPLSLDAVKLLAAEEGGGTPSVTFAESCLGATGGNPFLLSELLRAVAEDGIDVEGEGSDRLARLAAAGASSAILGRLARLGELETRVARAVAILEPRAEVRLLAALAGESPERAAAAGGRLASAALLADGPQLAFAHPLVREAVLTDMGERQRRAAHSHAARLLDLDGADLDTVAAHLLRAEPMGDGWVAERLRGAATEAIGRGAPVAAVRYLRRAMGEPPPEEMRIDIERELGLALLRDDDEDGLEVLGSVHARARSKGERAEVAAVLSNSLMFRARHAEAEAILNDALDENPPDLDDPLGINLNLHLLLATLAGFEQLPARYLPDPDEVAVDTVQGRAILSQAAIFYAVGMGPISAVPRFVERLGLDAAREKEDAKAGYPGNPHLIALACADRGDLALERFPNLFAGAELRGTLSGVSGSYGSRSYCRFLDGDLSEAQADAEAAIRISVEAGFKTPLMSWLGSVAPAMAARGEAEAAVALVDRFVAEIGLQPGLPGALALIGRAVAKQSSGRHAEACEDYRAAGERLAWVPWPNPEAIGWQPGLARSLAAIGESEEAGRQAAAAVEAAERVGNGRGLGVALRARAAVVGGRDGIDSLRRSVELLGATRARLQLAESLVDLGSALRRANHRKDAREPLAEGMELAHDCGAAPLEERARTELAAAGARPRGVVRTGVDSLTPSELRVATLASEGLTNREIAQSLTVTTKTVETHLRHVFQKLDLAKRTELEGALKSG